MTSIHEHATATIALCFLLALQPIEESEKVISCHQKIVHINLSVDPTLDITATGSSVTKLISNLFLNPNSQTRPVRLCFSFHEASIYDRMMISAAFPLDIQILFQLSSPRLQMDVKGRQFLDTILRDYHMVC